MGDGHRPVRFLHACISFFSALLCIGVLYPLAPYAADMPVPSDQQVFASCAKVLPYLSAEPSLANPIGVGTVAVGGNTFDVKVGLNPFSGPVDVYFGYQADGGDLYLMHSDNSLQPASNGLVPWKSDVNTGLSGDLMPAIAGSSEMPASSVPPGVYTLYLVVTPAGDLSSYYIWQTSFSSTYPLVVSPSCLDFGTSSSPQASIAFVNASADAFAYQSKSYESAGDTANSYNIANNSCVTKTLNSGDWCSMDVTFTPGTSGKMIATFALAGNASTALAGNASTAGTDINIPIIFQSEGSSAGNCSVTISATGKSFTSAGGSDSFSVTAASGCSWTATANAGWIHITSGSSAAGNSVYYTVDQNTGTSTRTGTISVGDQIFTVTQNAPAASSSSCQNPTVSPNTFSPGAAGGTYSINVSTPSGCSWNADVSLFSAGWINVTTGRTYTGSGTVKFSVAASSGNRTGYLTVDGKSITVTQQGSGCSYSVSPGTQILGTSASSGNLTITAGANCPWTIVSSDTSWLTITSSAAGAGSGNVSYSVAADTANVKRTASIFVEQSPGTASLAVTQDPGSSGCNYSLSSYSNSFGVSGGNGSFNVATGSGCSWTATSNNSTWLHIGSTSGGMVSYTVDANTGSARTGTISAGGQTFTVSEAGTAPPSGAISYSSLLVSDPKGWTSGGNPVNAVSFYGVTMPASASTLQVNVSGEVPKAYNNDMLISDTDFGSQSNAVSLYNHFLAAYGYNGAEIYDLEYPSGTGAHYWFKFASSSESETVTVPNAAGTYYIMVINADPYDSVFLIYAGGW